MHMGGEYNVTRILKAKLSLCTPLQIMWSLSPNLKSFPFRQFIWVTIPHSVQCWLHTLKPLLVFQKGTIEFRLVCVHVLVHRNGCVQSFTVSLCQAKLERRKTINHEYGWSLFLMAPAGNSKVAFSFTAFGNSCTLTKHIHCHLSFSLPLPLLSLLVSISLLFFLALTTVLTNNWLILFL